MLWIVFMIAVVAVAVGYLIGWNRGWSDRGALSTAEMDKVYKTLANLRNPISEFIIIPVPQFDRLFADKVSNAEKK